MTWQSSAEPPGSTRCSRPGVRLRAGLAGAVQRTSALGTSVASIRPASATRRSRILKQRQVLPGKLILGVSRPHFIELPASAVSTNGVDSGLRGGTGGALRSKTGSPRQATSFLAYRKGNIQQNTCLIRGCFEVRIGIVLRGVPGSVTSGGTKSPRTMANSHISKGLRLRATWGGTAGTGLNSDPGCRIRSSLPLGQRTSATASWTKVQFFVLGGE